MTSPFVSCFASGSHLSTKNKMLRQRSKTRSSKIFDDDPNNPRKSIVKTYLESIEKQEAAKMDPKNGLDKDCEWMSINAILLFGILSCGGTDTENAQVY